MPRNRFSISEKDAGQRLDRFVAGMTGLTRSKVQALISEQAVKVGGEVKPKNYRLSRGDSVVVDIPPDSSSKPVPENIPLKIVHQDDDLAVISKPPGMVVHPAAGRREGTLVNALLYAFDDLSGIGGPERPGIVHRLDRDTSGLIVIAKNDACHRALKELVKERLLERRYLALVHNVPASRLGTVKTLMGRDPHDRKKMAVIDEGGKTAVTRFKVLETYADAALLEVELVTGRTHQIRVHLSYIGHPVAGDPEYGVKGKLERETGLSRQFLHAYRIYFKHPVTGDEINYEDPLPEDLEGALRAIRNA